MSTYRWHTSNDRGHEVHFLATSLGLGVFDPANVVIELWREDYGWHCAIHRRGLSDWTEGPAVQNVSTVKEARAAAVDVARDIYVIPRNARVEP